MNGLSQWDDRRLIEQAQRGNAVAFAELYRRYYRRIHQTIYRLLRHRDDAEDIVQNTFLNAWRSLGNFKGESEFFTWLYRIAVNLAISHQRRRSSGREKPLYEGDEQQRGYEPPAHAPHPATGLETQEDLEHLRHAMQGLSEDHRIIICLKDLEDMSYEEISRVLHIPIGTVRSRLHRARLELAQLLGLLTPTVETTNGVHQRSVPGGVSSRTPPTRGK